MSLKSGLNIIEYGGQGGVAIHNANIEKLDLAGMHGIAHLINFGSASANADFAQLVVPFQCYIQAVQISAYGGVPTGADMILKIKINGTTKTNTFTLPAGQTFVRTTGSPAIGDGIYVASHEPIVLFWSQVGSTNPGTNVMVGIEFLKRVMSPA